ncbi:MAG: hypothetical protein KGL67_02950 [Patescibacteria group bacterium]|nr:hypothetical protein [Patescibacteria group bacterium]
MSKSTIIILIAIVILIGASFLIYKSPATAPSIIPNISTNSNNPANPTSPVACTQEAKQCPDGSYVGRTGPNCQFAQCPVGNTSSKSGLSGMVTLGPTCPVEPVQPSPTCSPKPYATSISIMKAGSGNIIKTIQSNNLGAFSVNLEPGSYNLQAKGGTTLPRCGAVTATVMSGKFTNNIQISCDTGIR